MDSILDLVSKELVSVLSDALPSLSENWWNLYVLDQLTSNQARHLRGATPSLEALDLSAALRVFTRSFVEISAQRDLSRDCKNFAFQVIYIRNRHAHRSIEPATAEDRYRDLDTLERFITLLKAPGEMGADVVGMSTVTWSLAGTGGTDGRWADRNLTAMTSLSTVPPSRSVVLSR